MNSILKQNVFVQKNEFIQQFGLFYLLRKNVAANEILTHEQTHHIHEYFTGTAELTSTAQ